MGLSKSTLYIVLHIYTLFEVSAYLAADPPNNIDSILLEVIEFSVNASGVYQI